MNKQQIEEYYLILEESLSLAEQQQELKDTLDSRRDQIELRQQIEILEDRISENLKKMETLKKT